MLKKSFNILLDLIHVVDVHTVEVAHAADLVHEAAVHVQSLHDQNLTQNLAQNLKQRNSSQHYENRDHPHVIAGHLGLVHIANLNGPSVHGRVMHPRKVNHEVDLDVNVATVVKIRIHQSVLYYSRKS